MRTRDSLGSAGTSGKKGFTLIELLVVIAIIAILASILFPVFARARENARRTSCLSNLKQIGLGIMQYSQDYDENLPPASFKRTGYTTGWDLMAAAYMGTKVQAGKAPGMFQCPSDSVERVPATETPRSYAMTEGRNGVVSGTTLTAADGVTAMRLGAPLAAIGSPSTSLMVTEFPNDGNRFAGPESAFVQRPIDTGGNYRSQNCSVGQGACASPDKIIAPNHMDGWNYLFADGHAKWLKPEKTINTAGVTYPKKMANWWNGGGTDCQGTLAFPCGMWTINEDD